MCKGLKYAHPISGVETPVVLGGCLSVLMVCRDTARAFVVQICRPILTYELHLLAENVAIPIYVFLSPNQETY